MGLLLYVPRLARALGTRNVFSASTLDQMPKQLSSGLMFGHWLSIPVPDIERCDFLLMLGANPVASNGSLWTVPDFRGKAKALQARGGKLVVVDPRRTETARLADRHLFIRPGGDVFFLLGMAHTLFDEGLVRLGALAEPRERRRGGARGRPAVYARARRGPLRHRGGGRSASWPAPWPPPSGPPCTGGWAPARSASARSAVGWWTCSTCSPAISTRRAARCSPRPPPSPPTRWGRPARERASRPGAAGAASRTRRRCTASCP